MCTTGVCTTGGERYLVLDGNDAGHASADELGLIALVVPLSRADQRDQPIVNSGDDGAGNELVEDQCLQHGCAQRHSPAVFSSPFVKITPLSSTSPPPDRLPSQPAVPDATEKT